MFATGQGGAALELLNVDDARLQYEVTGTGEPVLLVHGALIARSFWTFVAEPAISERYRLITYHRRGYAGSTGASGPVSIARQAADCRALARHLGHERVHVAGHSYGGVIALHLALSNPDLVHTLTLLEPAVALGESGAGYRESLEQGVRRYREAGAAVVVDEFLSMRFGDGYRERLDRDMPGVFDQAVADAAVSFEVELPALRDWEFGEAEARRIKQPVLSVVGSESDVLSPRFVEADRLLREWLPDAEGFVLPGAAHGMQMQNPAGMARALAEFLAKHPMRRM